MRFAVVVYQDIALEPVSDGDEGSPETLTPFRSPYIMNWLCKNDKADATCVS